MPVARYQAGCQIMVKFQVLITASRQAFSLASDKG